MKNIELTPASPKPEVIYGPVFSSPGYPKRGFIVVSGILGSDSYKKARVFSRDGKRWELCRQVGSMGRPHQGIYWTEQRDEWGSKPDVHYELAGHGHVWVSGIENAEDFQAFKLFTLEGKRWLLGERCCRDASRALYLCEPV